MSRCRNSLWRSSIVIVSFAIVIARISFAVVSHGLSQSAWYRWWWWLSQVFSLVARSSRDWCRRVIPSVSIAIAIVGVEGRFAIVAGRYWWRFWVPRTPRRFAIIPVVSWWRGIILFSVVISGTTACIWIIIRSRRWRQRRVGSSTRRD